MKTLIAALFLLPVTCQASIFDWSGRTFSGSSQTYLNVDGTGLNITISQSIVGSGSYISGYPTVSSAFPVADALDLYVNFGDKTSYVLITVAFSAPTTGVSFNVFDIDTAGTSSPAGYRDEIRNPVGTGGSTFGATLTPVGTQSVANNGTTTASATAILSTGNLPDNNNAGTVAVNFGTANTGSSYSFQYGNPNNATVQDNPSSQAIGLGDITFTAVPETSTSLAALCLTAMFFKRRAHGRWSAPQSLT